MPVYEINGVKFEFEREPTEADIDEAAAQIAAEEGPGLSRRIAATGLRVVGPLVGGAIGAVATAGNPLGAAGGAGIGGAAVAPFAARLEGRTASGREVLGEGLASSIPGGVAGRVAKRVGGGLLTRGVLGAAEGAAQGVVGTEVATRVGQGRAPTMEERGFGAVVGGVFGGALDTLFGASSAAGTRQAAKEAVLRGEAPPTLDDVGIIPVTDSIRARGRIKGDEPLTPKPERPVADRRATLAEGEPVTQGQSLADDILPEGGIPEEFYTPEGKPVENGPQLLEQSQSLEATYRLQLDTEARLLDMLESEGATDPGLRGQKVTLRLSQAIARGDFDGLEFYKLLDENDLSVEEGAQILRDVMSRSGRQLNVMSQVAKKIQSEERLLRGAELAAQLEKDGLSSGHTGFRQVATGIRDLDNAGRAIAIGQIATAVRNTITQVGRLSLDLPLEALQQALGNTAVGRKIFKGVVNDQKKRIGNPFATAWGMVRAATPGDTTRLLTMLDTMGKRGKVIEQNLFGGQSLVESPVTASNRARAIRGLPSRMATTFREGRAEGRWVKAIIGPIADAATAVNQLQENYFRRARFQGTLEARARAKGHTWADVVDNPELLGADDFADAIDDALEVSFAVEPQDGFGKGFVRAMRAAQPISTIFAPYPRYMVNAGRFLADFNPLGTIRLLEQFKSQRNFGREFEILTRGAAGAAMLGGATMFQMSDKAGERWYEAKGEDGERINLIGAAGPFLPLLFMGRVIADQLQPDAEKAPIRPEDFAQGSIGLRLSPGAQAALDGLKAAAGRGQWDGLMANTERVAGEFISRFTVPLRSVKDFMGAYSQEERLYYDPRELLETPLGKTTVLNPTIQNIPGLGGKLDRPPGVSVATGKPREGKKTVQRQATGMTTRETTPLQVEMDKLGFDEFEFNPKARNPKLDRILSRFIGNVANRESPKLLSDPAYINASPEAKRVAFKKFMRAAAKEGRDAADAAFPQIALARKLARTSKLEKELYKKQGTDIDEIVQQLMDTILPGR